MRTGAGKKETQSLAVPGKQGAAASADVLRREALEHDLSPGPSALDQRMRALEIRGIDGTEVVGERALQRSAIHQSRDLVQQVTLLHDVGRREDRAREHGFPVNRHALAFEDADVERLRI